MKIYWLILLGTVFLSACGGSSVTCNEGSEWSESSQECVEAVDSQGDENNTGSDAPSDIPGNLDDPTDQNPVGEPPINTPPADEPPTDNPPVDEPPVDDPPADDPPVDDPPSDDPPSEEPPVKVAPPVGDFTLRDQAPNIVSSLSFNAGEISVTWNDINANEVTYVLRSLMSPVSNKDSGQELYRGEMTSYRANDLVPGGIVHLVVEAIDSTGKRYFSEHVTSVRISEIAPSVDESKVLNGQAFSYRAPNEDGLYALSSIESFLIGERVFFIWNDTTPDISDDVIPLKKVGDGDFAVLAKIEDYILEMDYSSVFGVPGRHNDVPEPGARLASQSSDTESSKYRASKEYSQQISFGKGPVECVAAGGDIEVFAELEITEPHDRSYRNMWLKHSRKYRRDNVREIQTSMNGKFEAFLNAGITSGSDPGVMASAVCEATIGPAKLMEMLGVIKEGATMDLGWANFVVDDLELGIYFTGFINVEGEVNMNVTIPITPVATNLDFHNESAQASDAGGSETEPVQTSVSIDGSIIYGGEVGIGGTLQAGGTFQDTEAVFKQNIEKFSNDFISRTIPYSEAFGIQLAIRDQDDAASTSDLDLDIGFSFIAHTGKLLGFIPQSDTLYAGRQDLGDLDVYSVRRPIRWFDKVYFQARLCLSESLSSWLEDKFGTDGCKANYQLIDWASELAREGTHGTGVGYVPEGMTRDGWLATFWMTTPYGMSRSNGSKLELTDSPVDIIHSNVPLSDAEVFYMENAWSGKPALALYGKFPADGLVGTVSLGARVSLFKPGSALSRSLSRSIYGRFNVISAGTDFPNPFTNSQPFMDSQSASGFIRHIEKTLDDKGTDDPSDDEVIENEHFYDIGAIWEEKKHQNIGTTFTAYQFFQTDGIFGFSRNQEPYDYTIKNSLFRGLAGQPARFRVKHFYSNSFNTWYLGDKDKMPYTHPSNKDMVELFTQHAFIFDADYGPYDEYLDDEDYPADFVEGHGSVRNIIGGSYTRICLKLDGTITPAPDQLRLGSCFH